MYESKEPLRNKYQTARVIKDLVNDYKNDLRAVKVLKGHREIPINDLSLKDYFNYVKNIPYRQDRNPLEIVVRPYYILKHQNLGMDCKKKAILIGSYCKLNNIPFRFIGSSKRSDKKVHHIFPQILLNGEWKNFDATYDYYKPFERKNLTYAEVL
jgi:hypothetical protein